MTINKQLLSPILFVLLTIIGFYIALFLTWSFFQLAHLYFPEFHHFITQLEFNTFYHPTAHSPHF